MLLQYHILLNAAEMGSMSPLCFEERWHSPESSTSGDVSKLPVIVYVCNG